MFKVTKYGMPREGMNLKRPSQSATLWDEAAVKAFPNYLRRDHEFLYDL